MKIKGITPVEQHVEKLVLVVFALFAMAMFVLQFNIFGDPNAVDIGQRKHVAPSAAVDVVREEAQRLEGVIEAGTNAADSVPTIVGPLERIETALATPAIDPSLWTVALGPGSHAPDGTRPPDELPVNNNGAQAIADVVPPAPTSPAARAFGATINPFVPAQIPALQPLLPTDQPFDLRAVSIQASFPAQEFRAALASPPADAQPLPPSWWSGVVEILDVEVMRDELAPDGSVVASTTLPPVPGFVSLREKLANPETKPRDLPDIQEAEHGAREVIRRTPVYDIIAGEPWVWPSLAAERNAADPNREQIQKLVDERRNTLREIEKIQNTQKQQENNKKEEKEPPPPPPQGGPRLPGGGGPAPPPSGGRPNAGGGAAAITKRIADYTKRVTEIETKLKDEFKRDPDGNSLERDAVVVFTEPVTSLTAADAPAAITVWTHDLHPQPGKSYQYRVRVWVTNPLCGKGDNLGPGQKSQSDALAIFSPWSAPTAPVTLPPSPSFFVASASTGEGLGGVALRRASSATLDVFDFHYGFWREGDATLAPGDEVRSTIKIPAMPRFEIKKDATGVLSLGETTQGPETLPIVRESYLVSVIAAGAGEGDLVLLASPDGSLELRQAGTDAESSAESRMLDSASKSTTAKVETPTPTGSKKQ